MRLELMIMSGVEDGLRLSYNVDNGDGQLDEDKNSWKTEFLASSRLCSSVLLRLCVASRGSSE